MPDPLQNIFGTTPKDNTTVKNPLTDIFAKPAAQKIDLSKATNVDTTPIIQTTQSSTPAVLQNIFTKPKGLQTISTKKAPKETVLNTPEEAGRNKMFDNITKVTSGIFKNQSISTDDKKGIPYVEPAIDKYLPKTEDLSSIQKNQNLNIKIPFTEGRNISIPFSSTGGNNEALNKIAKFPSDIFEFAGRAAVTTYEELKKENIGQSKTFKLSPILQHIYGDPEYETVNQDISKRISNGDGILSSYIGGISSKVMDVAAGAGVLAGGFRSLSKILETAGPDIQTVEAWKTLGSPQNITELKRNFRELSHQFHPDLTGGNDEAFKIISKAKDIVEKNGLPNTLDIARNNLSNYMEVIGRESKFSDPIFNLNTKLKETPGGGVGEKLPFKTLPGNATIGEPQPKFGMSIQPVERVGGEYPVKPYEETGDLTTKLLQKLEGKTTVSKQFISDLTNSGDMKQVEKDLVRQVLETEGDKVDVAKFAEKVKAELVPLKVNGSDTYRPTKSNTHNPDALIEQGNFTPKYENIALSPELRGKVANYKENIYESPIPTSAGDTHFQYTSKNYFGHTRVEDMADNSTRRVIEVQSDLYQKGNLEKEAEIRQAEFASGRKGYVRGEKPTPERLVEIKKLQQYNDPTAHFRMVREEVKKAALDGKTKLQFPTGETAMKIEGLGGENVQWHIREKDGKLYLAEPRDIKIGQELSQHGESNWIITDDLGDGKFKAVQKSTYNDSMKAIKAAGNDPERVQGIENAMKAYAESFDISGKVDTNNPIYKFYEKDLGRYLTNNFGAKTITDSKGVTWYEVPVSKEQGVKPVQAFKKTVFSKLSGPKITLNEAEKLFKDVLKEYPDAKVKLLFEPDLIKTEKATGIYTPAQQEFLNPLIELYNEGQYTSLLTLYHEAGHFIFDHYLTPEDKLKILSEARKEISLYRKINYKLDGYATDQILEEYVMDEYAKYKAKEAGFESKFDWFFRKVDEIIKNISSTLKDISEKWNKFVEERGGSEKGSADFLSKKEISETEKLVAEGKLKIKEKDGKKIFQYQKDGQWFTALNESQAVKIASQSSEKVGTLIEKVNSNTSGVYDRVPKKIVTLPDNIAKIIGDSNINLSEFVIAKIKGKIKDFTGHPKITDEVLNKLPENLSNPIKILKDTRNLKNKEYLFINNDPLHQIVVELERKSSGLTEINTIFDTTSSELKRLEVKLPVVYSSGETPSSRIHASQNESAGRGISGLQKDRFGRATVPSFATSPEGAASQPDRFSGVKSINKDSIPSTKLQVKPTFNDREGGVIDLSKKAEKAVTEIENNTKEISSEDMEYMNDMKDEIQSYGNMSALDEVVDSIVYGKRKIKVGIEHKSEARELLGGHYMRIFTTDQNAQALDQITQEIVDAGENISTDDLIERINIRIAEKKAQIDFNKEAKAKIREKLQILKEKIEARKKTLKSAWQKTYTQELKERSELEARTLIQQAQQVRETAQHISSEPNIPSLSDIVEKIPTPVKRKVHLFNYFNTPEKVLNKVGLGKSMKLVREGYENYTSELPEHIDLFQEWKKEIDKQPYYKLDDHQTYLPPHIKIFKFLDGNLDELRTPLSPTEYKVAVEIKDYLSDWALRFGLPEDRRISHYITHIFENEFITKEFDEDLSKVIQDKIPSEVYDPFLQQRLGAKGYKQDVWAALDAYAKRAVRKANMDPALESLKAEAEPMEKTIQNYVKAYASQVNLRPTNTDELLDNWLKQMIGYKFGQRPVNILSRKGRQMIYRGALGLNIGSALKNLTQGVNTYAALGERYTLQGYIHMMTNLNAGEELKKVGILGQDMIQDQTQSVKERLGQKMDKVLFFMFESAEKINRGSAYFGAKAKAINEGKTELEAVEYAKKIVAKTQFLFGSIDAPVALGSDIAKTIFQFSTFPIKQMEFLGGMARQKEWAGLLRYILASVALVYGVGKLFNLKYSDFNPLSFFAKFGVPPLLKLPYEVLKSIMDAPGYFGQQRTWWNSKKHIPGEKITDIGSAAVPLFPAGVQIQKSWRGLGKGTNPVKGAILGPSNVDKAKKPKGLPKLPSLPKLPKLPKI